MLPTFPSYRPIDTPFAVEYLWKTYIARGDRSLIERIITTAAEPMEGIEGDSGPLPPDRVKSDPKKNSRAELAKIAARHLVISEARWSLAYYIVRDPVVAKIAEKRRKTATGNEKAMLDFVFTHPPRSDTFLGELRMEVEEQKKAAPTSVGKKNSK